MPSAPILVKLALCPLREFGTISPMNRWARKIAKLDIHRFKHQRCDDKFLLYRSDVGFIERSMISLEIAAASVLYFQMWFAISWFYRLDRAGLPDAKTGHKEEA